MSAPSARPAVLVAIPAYNEEKTIEGVVTRLRESLPEAEVLVIDDGSSDGTAAALARLRVRTARHLCNLGYGRAIQTAIRYANRFGYDVLVTLDADGQHRPEMVREMLEAFLSGNSDYLIGSRYVREHRYNAPLGRRVGMVMFSVLTWVFTGQRVYDTTSGFKMLRRPVFAPLTHWHFVDFHAEAIVFLSRLGFRIGEHPITVDERRHGQSMYNFLSHLVYPLQTLLMIVLGVLEAELTRRSRTA